MVPATAESWDRPNSVVPVLELAVLCAAGRPQVGVAASHPTDGIVQLVGPAQGGLAAVAIRSQCVHTPHSTQLGTVCGSPHQTNPLHVSTNTHMQWQTPTCNGKHPLAMANTHLQAQPKGRGDTTPQPPLPNRPSTVITYGVVPVQHRLLWVDAVELVWVTILSMYGQQQRDKLAAQAAAAGIEGPAVTQMSVPLPGADGKGGDPAEEILRSIQVWTVSLCHAIVFSHAFPAFACFPGFRILCRFWSEE